MSEELIMLGATLFYTFVAFVMIVSICKWFQDLRYKTRIKCLCKHEYTIDFIWSGKECTDYDLICRKCKKKKTIRIYKVGFFKKLEVADSE